MNLPSELIYFDDQLSKRFPKLSEEFKSRIETALALLLPYAQPVIDTIPQTVAYFVIDGDENPEYDCCNTVKCTRLARKLIRSQYEKRVKLEERWHYNDGDHEGIDYCRVCGKPLNTQLTWVKMELEGIEQTIGPDFKKDDLINEAFCVYCVLDALPSNDNEISPYSQMHSERLEQAKQDLEEFYQRLSQLTDKVIAELSPTL